MKTLASLLLMSATFLGANAYAQEPPSVLEHRPAISGIAPAARLQVVREVRVVKTGRQISFNEIGQPVAGAAGDAVALEVIHLEAITVDVIGVYPPQNQLHNTTFRAADEATDGPKVAEASAVNVIGIYPSGDESYKTAFSVVHAPRG